LKRPLSRLLIATVAAGLVAAGYWWFSRGGGAPEDDETSGDKTAATQQAIASVKVAPIKKETIAEEITVYGTVVPAAGAVQTVSLPFESRVRRILITEGQKIAAGEVLMEIAPSPDTNLQVQQARNEYDSDKKAFEYMRQRFDLKLATNDQLLQTQQALEQAQAKLESMRRRGSEGPRTIHADVAGLIAKVVVQEGAIVPAGSSLIEVVAQNRLAVRLGVEPENIDKVKLGQTVLLRRVNVPESEGIAGKIGRVSRAADPTTRLVQVFADLPSSSQFLLGEYVLGNITIASAQGLIVPRAAVMPRDDHYVLFTIREGHAREHNVRVGLQNKNHVEVIGTELHADEPVVTLGNYELKDGMPVKVDGSR
jgi:membrane fusion protein (multidrug efflux system)